jgi:membrane protein YdbS with pleckstrin-like domain
MSEPILWSSYPSWRQFSWLYFIAAMVAWRAFLFWRFGVLGWGAWLIGALVLLATAAIIRRWARYELTPTRLVMRNGYTGREIGAVALEHIEEVDIRQGPIADFLAIGTVLVRSRGETALRLRGLSDPYGAKQRIDAARRQSRPSGAKSVSSF